MRQAGKVVFIGPFGLQPKGTMRVRALPLAKALAGRGYTVTVLLPPWDDPERAGQVWVEDGVQIINVPLPPRLPLLFHLGLTWSLVRQTLALQPQVIHFFKPKAYAGLAHLALWGLKRLRRLPLRLVLDADDWEQAWNDRLPYSELQKRFFTWQERWGLSHADSITVASRTLEQMVITHTGRPPAVFYVPNGFRPELDGAVGRDPAGAEAVRARWGLEKAPVILLYSRFLEFRLERIVTLIKLVAAQRPEARWLIIGNGWQGEEKDLEVRVAGAGLSACTRFAGWVPAEELPAYFSAADVAIYPYDDTLINRTKCAVKLIDLLKFGLPVAADAIGQNCEYIRPGQSGLLAPAENDQALAEALVTLLEEHATRQKLGQAAAQNIRDNYSWSNLSAEVERAYLEVSS